MTRLKQVMASVSVMLIATAALAAGAVIDGTSAPLWKPATGWVTQPPAKYGVANEGGSLVFSAEGANTEMPWLLRLEDAGVSGDERYLQVRYRAKGMSTRPGVYFLHGEEGTRGGRAYAMADELQPDDQWHTLAVDLIAVQPLETTYTLALKVFVDETPSARLEIAKLWFSNDLSPEAKLSRVFGQRAQESVPVPWGKTPLEPREGWTLAPASDFSATAEGDAVTFMVRGQGKGMRWLMAVPPGVDLARLPYLSVRYKASGPLGASTYAIWLGDRAEGTGGNAMVALSAGDLKPDGAWHNLSLKLQKTFSPTHLAIGLDSDGEQVSMTLSGVTFSSQPLRWALQEVLPYETRPAAWPAGQEGFVAQPVAVTGGTPSPFLGQRLSLRDWFSGPNITVGGIPFAVAAEPMQVMQSPTTEFGALSLNLPAKVAEVYLLTAAVAPATEPWGIEWQNPKPQEVLDVPEKVYYEIRYAQGPPDVVLPIEAATGQWGMRRGLGVSIVHPDPTRQATEIVLADRMQTASFAIIGATMLVGKPRVAEPSWESLSYATPPAKGLAAAKPAPAAQATEPTVNAGVLQGSFDTRQGLTWSGLGISGLAGALSCDAGPVFEVEVGGKVLPAADWLFEKMEPVGAGRRFTLHDKAAGLGAIVECAPGAGNELLLRMRLVNEGAAATTATLSFPVLRGLRLGSAADTWYLCGKRGGIINSAQVSFREPMGERHPLQMDGFFNPRRGLALACLTHDTEAKHHFIALAKGSDGGAWLAEYVERDLAPGASFEATEAALVVREGDWRAIFAAYTDWLKSWFKPVSPRKPWFERIFALASGNAHYDMTTDPKKRGDLQPQIDLMMKYIGLCDYAHLFGWGASKQYGDWGDYDHYEEVGGLEYFRGNIQRVQQAGIAVSLYLDGFLNSEKGQSSGAHAKEWAMKHADGSPQYVQEYESYNECPYMAGWRDFLSETYARVHKELGPKIMYIDEIGATDGRWTCYAKDHGHNGYEIPYAGEVAMLKAIREAVGPEVALYTEYPPAEVSRGYIDGSITYQALWSAPQEPLAPHFIDLPRFAFPGFKQFHIIYYVTTRSGNWWLLKYPFFNGEEYRIGVPGLPGMDAPSLAFQKRAVQVQCAHREAFSSQNVAPLVPTEVVGVFANRFTAAKENVWTLYNANGRSVRRPVLRVKHVAGAQYEDAWAGRKLTPQIKDGTATLAVELMPKGIGCVVQTLP